MSLFRWNVFLIDRRIELVRDSIKNDRKRLYSAILSLTKWSKIEKVFTFCLFDQQSQQYIVWLHLGTRP